MIADRKTRPVLYSKAWKQVTRKPSKLLTKVNIFSIILRLKKAAKD